MKKLELNVDELSVDSFPTVADRPSERGTVQGRSLTWIGDSYCASCNTYSGPVNCIC